MRNVPFLFLCISLLFVLNCAEEKTKKIQKQKNPTEVPATIPKKVSKIPVKTDPVPPKQLKKAKEIIASASDEAIAAVDPKKKFKMLCASCHGFKGNLGTNGAKDLTVSTISLTESVAQIYHGKGLMTPFKSLLSEAEIVAIAQYIEQELRK